MIPLTFLVYSSLLVIANGPTKDARYMPGFLSGQAIRQHLDFQNLSKIQAQQQPTPCRVASYTLQGEATIFGGWLRAGSCYYKPQIP